jgi:hypothetical protein
MTTEPPPGWQQSPPSPPPPPTWQQPPPPPYYTGMPPQPDGKPPWYRRTWLVATATLGIGLVIGAAIGAGSSDDEPAAGPEPTPATVTVTEVPATTEPTDTSAPPSTDGGETADSGETGVRDLGDTASVGKDYTVSVKEVVANANDIIASANSFNDPPKGQYVLAEIRTKYVGRKEGDPWLDLTMKYVGTDHRQYDESSCGAVVPHESIDVPTLQHGGAATFQICFDIPPKAIAGGEIFVEDSFSFSDAGRVYWRTR